MKISLRIAGINLVTTRRGAKAQEAAGKGNSDVPDSQKQLPKTPEVDTGCRVSP